MKFIIRLKQLLSIAILCFNLAPIKAFAETRLGVSLPLTGPAAPYGSDVKAALEFLAVRLPGEKVSLDFQDDSCDPKTAVAVAQLFTTSRKVSGVTGFVCSGALRASGPIYDRANIVAIGTLTTSSKLSEAGSHVFRAIPTVENAAKLLRKRIAANHSSVGILSEQTEFCSDLLSRFIDWKENSLEIFVEEHPTGSSDLRSPILRLMGNKPQALLLNSQTPAGLMLAMRQLDELNIHIPIYAHAHPESTQFLEAWGHKADGLTFTSFPSPQDVLTPRGRDLYKDFLKFHPNQSIPHAFTFAIASLEALQKMLSQSSDPVGFLHSHQFSDYLVYHFSNEGALIGPNFVLKQLRGGRAVAVPYEDVESGNQKR